MQKKSLNVRTRCYTQMFPMCSFARTLETGKRFNPARESKNLSANLRPNQSQESSAFHAGTVRRPADRETRPARLFSTRLHGLCRRARACARSFSPAAPARLLIAIATEPRREKKVRDTKDYLSAGHSITAHPTTRQITCTHAAGRAKQAAVDCNDATKCLFVEDKNIQNPAEAPALVCVSSFFLFSNEACIWSEKSPYGCKEEA